MIRRLPLCLCLAAAVLPLRVASAATSPDLSRMLLTDKHAILVAPAETVAGWNVNRAAWAPSGQYVLASRVYLKLPPIPTGTPDFQQSLVLWDMEQRKATELWKVVVGNDQAPHFDWLAAGDVAFALAKYRPTRPAGQAVPPQEEMLRHWVLRVDARRGAMKPLFSVPEQSELLVSPREPLAVVFSQNERLLRIVRSDGTLLRPVSFPIGVDLGLPRWSSDGARFLMTSYVVPDSKNAVGAAAEAADYALDVRTAQLVKQATREKFREPEANSAATGELRLRQTKSVVQVGNSHQTISPLWLEVAQKGPESSVLISADAEWGELSPRGDAVLFLANGAASVTSLVTLPKELFIQARQKALQMVALSNGRQLGLAAIIYAQKHEDSLPSADQPVAGLLREYANADSLYEGFVYTFPGGKLTDVAEPSKTMLGYILGPGGRAEIFVDGHVTWKKDE